ncbi:3TM-type holin [Pyramidobacter porci]
MNLLELVPGVSAILDKVITTPGELEKIKMEIRKIDMSEVTARLNVQKAWLGNKSPYVAGAIPTVIWMCCAVIAFNHIAAPLLSWLFSTAGWLAALCGASMPPVPAIPTLELPDYYVQAMQTIVLGLFAKKAYDGTAIDTKWVKSPVKQEAQPEAKQPLTAEEVDRRFEALCRKYGVGDRRRDR